MDDPSGKALAFPEYWNSRYVAEAAEAQQDTKFYEWFRTFETLRPYLAETLPSAFEQPYILHLGCGLSSLPKDLFDIGYRRQVGVDFSETAIDLLKHKYSESNGLEWQIEDVRKMSFATHNFDVAIDKGTMDAMLHGSLWDPADVVKANVSAYIDEVARILRPGGSWIYITYRQPHFLKPLLRRDGIWTVDVQALQDNPGSFEYFAFKMRKATQNDTRKELRTQESLNLV